MKQTVNIVVVSAVVLMAGCAVIPEGTVAAGGAVRERLSMDFGWKFHLGHLYDMEKDFGYFENLSKSGATDGPYGTDFEDSNWQNVDLPHDWLAVFGPDKNADELHAYRPIGPKYPQNSIGWYRKTFEIPESDLGKRLSLEFDGIYRDSRVWLNGHSLAQHLSGYTSFGVDITDYVNYGGTNVLVVRVNASGVELWSYEGAGIYRHVWLVKTQPLHVVQWGTYVSSNVKLGKSNKAGVTIRTNVANEQDEDKRCELIATIVDAEGETVATVKSRETIKAWSNEEITQKVKVRDAKLWSVESPYLYRLLTTVKEQGKVTDMYETSFGIRTFRFDSERGFFLNGENVRLNGVCLHQDHGGVGVAIPDRIHDFRIKKMKEMGANAFRCAHNWVAPEALDAADRLGMLVIDETRAPGNTKERMEQLGTMIQRDRNHPSIILWSLANEEKNIQKSKIGARIIKSMKRLARKLDPTRPVTMALTGEGLDTETSRVLDVQGCNYLKDYLDDLHEKYPDRPYILTEACCHSTARGVYEPDEDGRLTGYDENPACWGNTAEKMWTWCAERPWMAGTFIWTGFDYAGEPLTWEDDCGHIPSEEVWPIQHTQWGIVDRCGFEKDPFYYFKSWWTDEVVVHLFPHWNWQGKEGQEIRVWCYSNCEEVELIVNGSSLGRKKMPRNSHLEWKVKYEPGYIEARGYNGDWLVATDRQDTTGQAAAIVLKADRTKIKADNRDVSLVTVKIVDEKGRFVPTANDEITLTVSDNGKIIGLCNGDPACPVGESCTTFPAFSGLAMVFIQSGFEAGPIKLKAEAQGLQSAEVVIEAEPPCTPEPFIPSITKDEKKEMDKESTETYPYL